MERHAYAPVPRPSRGQPLSLGPPCLSIVFIKRFSLAPRALCSPPPGSSTGKWGPPHDMIRLVAKGEGISQSTTATNTGTFSSPRTNNRREPQRTTKQSRGPAHSHATSGGCREGAQRDGEALPGLLKENENPWQANKTTPDNIKWGKEGVRGRGKVVNATSGPRSRSKRPRSQRLPPNPSPPSAEVQHDRASGRCGACGGTERGEVAGAVSRGPQSLAIPLRAGGSRCVAW